MAKEQRKLTCRRDCACYGRTGNREVCSAQWMDVLMPPIVFRDGFGRIEMDPRKCIYMLPRALGF